MTKTKNVSSVVGLKGCISTGLFFTLCFLVVQIKCEKALQIGRPGSSWITATGDIKPA